jgi:hypothetical protein
MSATTPPEPHWDDRTREMYAQWFVDCHYFEPADGETYPRRSEADAYEEWKPVAAALGVWRTQQIDIPPDVCGRINALYRERGEAEVVWDEG